MKILLLLWLRILASQTELKHNKLGVKIDSSFNFNFFQLKPILLSLSLCLSIPVSFSLSVSFYSTTFVLLLNVAQFCFYVEKNRPVVMWNSPVFMRKKNFRWSRTTNSFHIYLMRARDLLQCCHLVNQMSQTYFRRTSMYICRRHLTIEQAWMSSCDGSNGRRAWYDLAKFTHRKLCIERVTLLSQGPTEIWPQNCRNIVNNKWGWVG